MGYERRTQGRGKELFASVIHACPMLFKYPFTLWRYCDSIPASMGLAWESQKCHGSWHCDWQQRKETSQVLSHWMFSNDRQSNKDLFLTRSFPRETFHWLSSLSCNEMKCEYLKIALRSIFSWLKYTWLLNVFYFCLKNIRWHYKRHMWQTVLDSKSLIFLFLFVCEK